MNELPRTSKRAHATTQAAEGYPRWRWTLEEFERLIEHGLLTEADHVELIGGELVPMAPKGNRHERVRDELQDTLSNAIGRSARLSSEIGWQIGDDTYLEPDIMIYPRGFSGTAVPPQEVLVLLEVADTSLRFDSGTKAKMYASLGVREYWVVNARTLETIVHLEPGEQGYANVSTYSANQTLAPRALPGLTVELGTLKIA